MRECLAAGTIISFGGENGKSFIIKSLLSSDGASCLVYLASSPDRLGKLHDVVLKELFPQGLDIKRDSCSLIIPEKSRESFELYKNRFKEAYSRQVTFRQIDEAINKSSDARGIYEGYNTFYIEMQCDYGYCYNQVKDESLCEILKTARALSEAVKVYHDNGLLHLDIKPANIFILHETNELVRLFDFDSVISKQEAVQGNSALSFSERWAAPELLLGKHEKLSAATDVYSIGVIVFNRIFGRTPAAKDRRYDSVYDFTANKLFNNISPSIFKPLTHFFNKTLQSTPEERYQSARELISALDILIPAARPKNIFLPNHNFLSSDQFTGRVAELRAIKEKLKQNGFCFLHGMGGIGKTEIAKRFAVINRDTYHTVYTIRYSGDLKQDIINMDFINLDNMDFADEKGQIDTEKLYKYKKDKIQELDEGTLIIVDNFNTDTDQYINDIISNFNKHHTIFTTRNEVYGKAKFYVEIEELSPELSLKLFYEFYKDRSDEKNIIEIIEHVRRNTLAIKLIAATMQTGGMSPLTMLEKLLKGTGSDIAVRIKHNRDILQQNIENETLINHLSIVFNTALLSDEQKYLMMNMRLTANCEISENAFLKLLGVDFTKEMFNSFNALIEQNWIQKDYGSNMISLHPIVSSVVLVQLQPDPYKCKKLVTSIAGALCDCNNTVLTEKQKISLGEGILKQNPLPRYLQSVIFYGLSLQYNSSSLRNLAKALDYATKADINHSIKYKLAKEYINEFNSLISEDQDLLDFHNYKRLKTALKENLALINYQSQQYRKALKCLKHLNKSADVVFLAGKCQYALGDYDNALSIFETALLKYGFDEEKYKKAFGKTDGFFTKLMKKMYQFILEDENDFKGDCDEGSDSQDTGIDSDKVININIADCLKWIASCYNMKGAAKKSLLCARLLKSLKAENILPAYNFNMLIAEIYQMNAYYAKANIYIEAALKESASTEQELNILILLAESQNKACSPSEALTSWKKALEIALLLYDLKHETSVKILMNIGDCHLQDKNYQFAQRCYEEINNNLEAVDYNRIIISKKLADIYALQGYAELSEKTYDSAISLASASNLVNETADLYFNKGLLYHDRNLDKAIECFEKCLYLRKSQLHMEDRQVVECQKQLQQLYQQKHKTGKAKTLNKQVKKAASKADPLMIVFGLLLIAGSVYYTYSAGWFFRPSVSPFNAIVQGSVYVVAAVLFALALKIRTEKAVNSINAAITIICVSFLTFFAYIYIFDIQDKSLTVSFESNNTDLAARKILDILTGFELSQAYCLIPLVIFTWFLAYKGVLNHTLFTLIFSIIFTLSVGFFTMSSILFFLFIYICLLMKNTREKWLFPGPAEKFVMLFSFAICALILSPVLSNVLKHSVFVDITSPILQLPSLNFFTPTKDAVTIYLKQYPILNIMAFKGVFTGILLAVSYFGFVVVSMRNAKRIKSVYLRTVYQTICLFFLFTGILNILSGFVDYFSQVKLSKVIIAEDILFPFLSPNPVYLISSFFFAGILFGIFYNRVRE